MKKLTAIALLCLLLIGCRPKMEKPIQTDPPVPVPERIFPTAEAATEEPAEEPTEEPTEPPAEEPTQPPENQDLVLVTDFIPGVCVELAYATEQNFTGQTIYEFTECYLRYGTVKKLKLAAEELAEQGLGILIWDGFRPVAAQQKLWDVCPDAAFVSHPVTGYRAHCRGNAVDLTLVDLQTGEELEMPTGFDVFTALADRDYSDCTQTAAENARLLEEVMQKHGFTPYSAEWWHFTDMTDYPVDEDFNPAGVG